MKKRNRMVPPDLAEIWYMTSSFVITANRKIGIILLSLLVFACKSNYQKKEDFDLALQRAYAGEFRKVPREIQEALPEVPEEHVDQALSTIASIQGSEAQLALIEILHNPKTSPHGRKKIFNALLERNEENLGDHLQEYLEKKPERLNDESLLLLGARKHLPALPLILSALEKEPLRESAVRSLYLMKEEEQVSNELSKIESNPNNPSRIYLFQEYLNENDPELHEATLNKLLGMVRHSEREQKSTLNFAAKVLQKEKPHEYSWAVMNPFTRTQVTFSLQKPTLPKPPQEEKKEAVEPSEIKPAKEDAETKKEEVETKEPEIEKVEPAPPPAIATQETTIKQKTTEKPRLKPATQKKQHEKKKVAGKKREKIKKQFCKKGKTYEDSFLSYLGRHLSRKELKQLSGSINNGLASYADSDSEIAQFILRAYKKKYKTDEKKIRQLIRGGLSTNGSIHALTENLKKEYDYKPLRIYALSEILQISRPTAELLLQFSENCR